ncbi:MAG: hypothetical protein JEY91_07485 [Spirochaetaceae bacterium]|nr:hypothetical protein [Spirochaetaceae bacterium]
MKKNLSTIYTIAVLIILVLLGAWSTWDVYQLRTSNTEAAQLNIEKIKQTVENSYNKGIPFNDTEFSKLINTLLNDNPELEIVTIYSHDEDVGITYHYNKSQEIQLLNLDEASPLTERDLPEYKYNQLMKSKLTRDLNAADMTGLNMDLIYQVVDRSQIYNILIRVLLVVIVLFFITLFMIFTVSRKKENIPVTEKEDFDIDSTSDDEILLDWDEQGFDDSPAEKGTSEDLEDINLDMNDDFGDLNLDSDSFNDVSDDFESLPPDSDSGDMENINFDADSSDDFGDLALDSDSDNDLGDLSLDSESDNSIEDMNDEISFDDLDLDSDIPEEEDLLAMDHELSPSEVTEDFNFDEIDDTFTPEEIQTSDSTKSSASWENFIEERVNLELERAASFDQDIVMGIIQCEGLTEENYKIFTDQLKEDFNNPDMIFEYNENGLALIGPDTDLDSALVTLEEFTGKEQEDYGEINVGISSRNSRLLTGSRIFMEAENALNKAVNDSEKNIVGFRSDPDKFREFLTKKE